MAFTRPTLAALVSRIRTDLTTRLSLVAPILRKSVAAIIGTVMAGAAHLLHGHLEFLSEQVFPDLSDGAYLLRQGGLYGLTLNAATFAAGNVGLTGSNGSTLAAGSVLLRSDGTRYTTDALATIAGGVATVAVTAEVAAADGDCAAATVLTLESPPAGIDATGTVAGGGLTGGGDEETTEQYRVRVLARIQDPPHGGNATDYVAWAKEVAGVTRAWCYPLELGAGTVVVRFMRDDDVGSPIPSAGEVAAVQAYIDALRPVTAALTVAAPSALVTNFTVAVTPNTAATRAAVQAELEDLLLYADPGVTIPHSAMVAAAQLAAGVTGVVVSVPAGDVAPAVGQIPTVGTFTFV